MSLPTKIPYFYHALYDMADQLDSYTVINQRDFSHETIERLTRMIPQLREMYRAIRDVDHLFAGVISEEEFLKNES